MATKNFGALPMQIIRGLMQTEYIKNVSENNLQPASLDFALSEEIYRIDEVIMPYPGEPIAHIIQELKAVRHDYSEPLLRGVTYLARLAETFALPYDIYAYANPKSSSGRNDIHVRVLADGTPRFDCIPAGFRGTAWVTITPQSYPIKLTPGETLTQIRFFSSDTRMTELELRIAMDRDKLLWNKQKQAINYNDIAVSDRDGSLILSADVSEKLIGW